MSEKTNPRRRARQAKHRLSKVDLFVAYDAQQAKDTRGPESDPNLFGGDNLYGGVR